MRRGREAQSDPPACVMCGVICGGGWSVCVSEWEEGELLTASSQSCWAKVSAVWASWALQAETMHCVVVATYCWFSHRQVLLDTSQPNVLEGLRTQLLAQAGGSTESQYVMEREATARSHVHGKSWRKIRLALVKETTERTAAAKAKRMVAIKVTTAREGRRSDEAGGTANERGRTKEERERW